MKKFTCYFYGAIALLFTVLSSQTIDAQCTFTSTDGYIVRVAATPVSVIAPTDCPNGFNYNLKVNYSVTFTGTNIPANLWTLQGKIYCGGQENFFSMPLNGGTGTANSVSNPYRSTTNCASASPASLNCNSIEAIIQGPGLNYQSSVCPTGGILPVNLISFNGKLLNNNNVLLQWVTASETNNRSFTIERSKDSRNWEAIKTINGSGNSGTRTTYTYTDENLSVGMYYYRLKQNDISGTFSYSNIIGANITKAETANTISLISNNNQLYISGLGNYNEWQLQIISTTSATILNAPSLTSSTISLPAMTAGVYIVKLHNKISGVEKAIRFIY